MHTAPTRSLTTQEYAIMLYAVPVIMASINLANFDCALTCPDRPYDALSCSAIPYIDLPVFDAFLYDLHACLPCRSTCTDRSNSKLYDSIDLINSYILFFLAVLLRRLLRAVQRVACIRSGPTDDLSSASNRGDWHSPLCLE